MDPHRLRFEKSLALHAAVAERLVAHPEIVERARRKLDEWLAAGGSSSPLLAGWRTILDRPLAEIAAALTERTEAAAWLRKASPFAGVLDSRERMRILREVRESLESAESAA